MWLNLNLDGIDLHLQITGYKKSDPKKWDDQWCGVDITLESSNRLNYHISSSILESCEVEEIRDTIADLLQDKITTEQEMTFTEPELTFILHPKRDLRMDTKYIYIAPGHEIVDIDADLHIYFWNGGLTANYLSLCFDRTDLEKLLVYLELITKKISKNSDEVQELIAADILREYYN